MREHILRTAFAWGSLVLLMAVEADAQSYTSYFTGNTTDMVVAPAGGICMMGGASESDEAMQWFLHRANGGDALVLRASGSDGYNNYMYSSLGVTINSVETIVFNNGTASFDPYVHQRIQQAEAIWFAGGDQWDYVSYWRNTPVDSLVNDAVNNRGAVIGGTSAGMAILGSYYFSAQNGSVTSGQALNDPYNTDVTVDGTSFLQNAYLQNVITDTHYDNPDRKGRHVAFLARILTDDSIEGRGIACDEYTAVCIDTTGIARVYGEHPTSDDNAYFLQVNCELSVRTPETCTAGQRLTWNRGGDAVKVYQAKGTTNGSNTFDLNDWRTGSGGTWHNWSVNNSILNQAPDSVIACGPVGVADQYSLQANVSVHPNPTEGKLFLSVQDADLLSATIITLSGRRIRVLHTQGATQEIDLSFLPIGFYGLELLTSHGRYVQRIIRQ